MDCRDPLMLNSFAVSTVDDAYGAGNCRLRWLGYGRAEEVHRKRSLCPRIPLKPKLRPMQPSPMAETPRLLFPSLRFFMTSPFGAGSSQDTASDDVTLASRARPF